MAAFLVAVFFAALFFAAVFLGVGIAGPLRDVPAARAGSYALIGIVFLIQARSARDRKAFYYGLGIVSLFLAVMMLLHGQTASPS